MKPGKYGQGTHPAAKIIKRLHLNTRKAAYALKTNHPDEDTFLQAALLHIVNTLAIWAATRNRGPLPPRHQRDEIRSLTEMLALILKDMESDPDVQAHKEDMAEYWREAEAELDQQH